MKQEGSDLFEILEQEGKLSAEQNARLLDLTNEISELIEDLKAAGIDFGEDSDQ